MLEDFITIPKSRVARHHANPCCNAQTELQEASWGAAFVFAGA
jgi:hypothetical protein